RAERLASANTREELDDVALDLHASAASVALLAPRELFVDVFGKERQACGKPLENCDECLTVRFACRSEAEHCASAREDRVIRKEKREASTNLCALPAPRFPFFLTLRNGLDVRRANVDHDQ